MSFSSHADDDDTDTETEEVEDLVALIADPISFLDNGAVEEADSEAEDDREDDTVDLVHMAMPSAAPPQTHSPSMVVSATAKSRPLGLPDWAAGYLNFRGLIALSLAHSYGVAAFNGSVTDVLLDTGGGRTMMDLASACKMGLSVQLTDKEVHFGSWSGPGDKPQHYVGRVPGPILVRFDQYVVVPLAEIKLIETAEPLIIMGSDFMAPPAVQKGWRLRDIGYND